MVIRGKPTKETLRHIYLTILETIKKESCYKERVQDEFREPRPNRMA